MFEDLIKTKKKKKSKKINLISKQSVSEVLLRDAQEVIFDLFREPCYYCGRAAGEYHAKDCKFLVVMEELDRILRKGK
jgi:hypothetical protein